MQSRYSVGLHCSRGQSYVTTAYVKDKCEGAINDNCYEPMIVIPNQLHELFPPKEYYIKIWLNGQSQAATKQILSLDKSYFLQTFRLLFQWFHKTFSFTR